MWKRSTIFLSMMLTGTFAAAALVSEDKEVVGEVVAPLSRDKTINYRTQSALPVLQLQRLVRTEVNEPELDPFAGKSWYVAPPPPPISKVKEVPPAPSAPAFPYRYMGMMQEEGERVVVYLTQGNRTYSVYQGDTINNVYQVESIAGNQMVLTYLPLDIKQTLSIGGTSEQQLASAGEMSSLEGDIPQVTPSAPLPLSGMPNLGTAQ